MRDELREARAQKRITSVPYDRSTGVDVVFDLGRSDHTSMWFVQRAGWELHYIDFYQSKLHHIDHYLALMQTRGYTYDTIWLPHDAKAKRLGSKMTIEEQIRAKGFDVRIVPRVSVLDKINAGRTVFPNAWFDQDRCSDGLHSLRNWKYEVKNVGEDGREVFSQTPLHNWASDAADAFCYSGLAASAGRKRDAQGRKRDSLRSLLTPESWLPAGATSWMGR